MVKLVYRPISFYFAAFFANLKMSGNDVSVLSAFVGISACILFLFNNYTCGIIAAIIVNIWIIMDCTDGNIARSVKAIPYGDFLDSTSCYILVGILFNVLGYRAYQSSSLFFSGKIFIVLLGALTASFDSITRLVYQRYLVSSYNLGINEKVESDITKVSTLQKIRLIIDLNIGIGGFFPLILLLSIFFSFLDIVVIGYFLYYGFFAMVSISFLTFKALKKGNKLSQELNVDNQEG